MRRSRDASEQNLKKLKLNSLELESKNSSLVAQLDETALSLEETRVTLVAGQRDLTEVVQRLKNAENQVAELRVLAGDRELQLRAALNDLRLQQTARAEIEQKLQETSSVSSEARTQADLANELRSSLERQLEEKQTAYATLERMLQEATAMQVQVRRDMKDLVADREQLELQNIELKGILDQLSGRAHRATTSASQSGSQTQESKEVGPVRVEWYAVSESEIGDTVALLSAMPAASEAAPTAPQNDNRSILEDELRQTKLNLQLLQSSMGDLEYLRDQNAKLREELAADRHSARELIALQLDHKRLKLDFQFAQDKLGTHLGAAENLSILRTEMHDLKGELDSLTRLREQVRDLRAENFALRNANSGMYRVIEPLQQNDSDLRELSAEPLDTAVLADHLGLPVAATGQLSAESLAAVSGLATRVAVQVRELLPVGPIVTVQLVDRFGMVVTCKLFQLAGDDMAMTTMGNGNPSEQALKETLRKVLNSIGWSEDGPSSEVASNVGT
jgi:hypothetical protein